MISRTRRSLSQAGDSPCDSVSDTRKLNGGVQRERSGSDRSFLLLAARRSAIFVQQLFGFHDAAATAVAESGPLLEFLNGINASFGQFLDLAIVHAVAEAHIHDAFNTLRLILSVNPVPWKFCPDDKIFVTRNCRNIVSLPRRPG